MKNILCSFLFLVSLFTSTAWASTEAEIETRLNSSFDLLLQQLPLLQTREEAKDVIRSHVMPLTDIRSVGQLMLGKYWRSASESQRSRFVTAMSEMLVNTYAAFLLDKRASAAHFNVVRITKRDGSNADKYSVATTVTIDRPIEVDFQIYQRPGKDWKIIDVSVEGISMVLTWRSTLNQLIASSSLESVISDLEAGKIKAEKKE